MSLGNFPKNTVNWLNGALLRLALGRCASKKLQRRFEISEKTAELWLAQGPPISREPSILLMLDEELLAGISERVVAWNRVRRARTANSAGADVHNPSESDLEAAALQSRLALFLAGGACQ